MQIVNCLPLFSSRNICRARWRVTFHTISHFVHFLVTKEAFRCSNVTKKIVRVFKCDKIRLFVYVTKSPLTYSNVTQKQGSDGQACIYFLFLQKTTFSLVKSRLALGSPGSGWSFVHLFVTRPKMAKYTVVDQTTRPGMRNDWSSQSFANLTLGLVFPIFASKIRFWEPSTIARLVVSKTALIIKILYHLNVRVLLIPRFNSFDTPYFDVELNQIN